MSVKLSSPKVELAVLRGLTSKDKVIRGELIGNIDESYFDSDESKEILRAVQSSLARTGEPPAFKIICEDQSLSREARSFFRDSQVTITTHEEARRAVKVLNGYRQTRGLYDILAATSRKLQGSKVDSKELLRTVGEEIGRLQVTKSNQVSFTHLGVGNNAREDIRSLLFDEDNELVIKTGIKAFDKESRGFLRGSLVSLGGSSGGGKSILGSTEMAVNMATMGYKVVVMPLEMSKQEMLGRFAAKICGIDSNKIITKQLATGEKKLVQEKMDTFMKKVAKKGGRLTIFKPKGDISIEETFAALNALDADVVIIDYISLLSGVDGDDAWQKLGAIARLAKVNAEMTNRVNILICQVNDDGTVRYSRAISEHSSNSWIWTTPLEERSKDVGVIKIKQPKARNSKSFPFEIGIEWRFMRTTDVLSEEQSLPEPKKNLTDI